MDSTSRKSVEKLCQELLDVDFDSAVQTEPVFRKIDPSIQENLLSMNDHDTFEAVLNLNTPSQQFEEVVSRISKMDAKILLKTHHSYYHYLTPERRMAPSGQIWVSVNPISFYRILLLVPEIAQVTTKP